MLTLRTGRATELGAIAERLRPRAPETNFARGIREFGFMLTYVMFALVLGITAAYGAVSELSKRVFYRWAG